MHLQGRVLPVAIPQAVERFEDYEYVDIDSYGAEEEAEIDEGAAAAGAAAAGAAGGAAASGDGSIGGSDGTAAAGAEPADEDGRGFAGGAARVGEVTMDLLVLRPVGACATVIGSGFLAVSSPFLLGSWDYSTAYDVFVADRARYTFDRPLGQF